MSRRALDISQLDTQNAFVTYQVSLEQETLDAVRLSFNLSGISWPEWVDAALARLLRESSDELKSLLSNSKPSSRASKKNLSFRVYPRTLTTIKKLAKDYESTVQVLLTHAFFMNALAVELEQADS